MFDLKTLDSNPHVGIIVGGSTNLMKSCNLVLNLHLRSKRIFSELHFETTHNVLIPAVAYDLSETWPTSDMSGCIWHRKQMHMTRAISSPSREFNCIHVDGRILNPIRESTWHEVTLLALPHKLHLLPLLPTLCQAITFQHAHYLHHSWPLSWWHLCAQQCNLQHVSLSQPIRSTSLQLLEIIIANGQRKIKRSHLSKRGWQILHFLSLSCTWINSSTSWWSYCFCNFESTSWSNLFSRCNRFTCWFHINTVISKCP